MTLTNPGPASVDHDEVDRKVKAICQRFDETPLEKFRAELNETLRGFTQTDWIGTFDELTQGDNAFAVEVRKGFSDNDNPSHSLDDPKGITRFIEYLETYGL
jgi:hypothetical protein